MLYYVEVRKGTWKTVGPYTNREDAEACLRDVFDGKGFIIEEKV